VSDITPGVWTVYEEGAEDGAQVWAREEGDAPSRVHVASHIGDADARLIAAAPELLATLIEMVMLRCLGGATPDNDSPTQRAVNVINKAEGTGQQ